MPSPNWVGTAHAGWRLDVWTDREARCHFFSAAWTDARTDCLRDRCRCRCSPTGYSASALFAGDAVSLPADAIHSVTNPLLRFTGGIHIYGGDFFNTARSQWDPETLAQEPSDGEVIRRMFERENERLGL